MTLTTRPRAPSWSSWPFAITLPQLSAFAVEDGAGQAMPAFVAVQLDQGAAPLGLIVDGGEHVQRLVDPAELRDGVGQCGLAVADLKGPHNPRGGHAAHFERSRETQHIVPVRDDHAVA